MRYFVSKTANTTLQAPDNVDAELLSLCEEVGWSWYLSQVKSNMKEVRQKNEVGEPLFIHAKYYGIDYMEEDRIGQYHHGG